MGARETERTRGVDVDWNGTTTVYLERRNFRHLLHQLHRLVQLSKKTTHLQKCAAVPRRARI